LKNLKQFGGQKLSLENSK